LFRVFGLPFGFFVVIAWNLMVKRSFVWFPHVPLEVLQHCHLLPLREEWNVDMMESRLERDEWRGGRVSFAVWFPLPSVRPYVHTVTIYINIPVSLALSSDRRIKLNQFRMLHFLHQNYIMFASLNHRTCTTYLSIVLYLTQQVIIYCIFRLSLTDWLNSF
jgi:hypothetical protein